MVARGIYITELPERSGGIRLAVKDLFDTAGVRTTYGSAIFAGHVPARTAEAVARLEAAGYVNVGKANLHEFAWGITSDNPHYGRPPSPLAADRMAGGSSGGCASALGLGLADAALGTDSGGSVRIPAACCGVVGFKPTYGLVPIDGCFPLAPSFDHVGPMARDVGGCVAMMGALVPGFPALPEVELADLAVGVAWTELADPLVRARVEAVAAAFPGARRLELPLLEGRVDALFAREAAETHASLWRDHRAEYGANVAYKLERAVRVGDGKVEAARRFWDAYRGEIASLTAGLDLVVTPTLTLVAPPADLDDLELLRPVVRLTEPWNVIGAPAIALPCGPAESGLPASVQLVGAPGTDALVLAAARTLECRLVQAEPD